MTENDKIALLETLNKISETLQYAIAAENEISDLNDVIEYHKIKSDLHVTIHSLINEVELRGCKVIWEGKKAVKIVEKEEKENDKR